MIVDMDISRIAILTILTTFSTFVDAYLELHRGETSLEGIEGSDIEIVCESDFRRYGTNDDELIRKISWLRGGPIVEDLDILASSDERVSIETEIVSETNRGVELISTLTIRGVTSQDATNYTCCQRDTPMCIWEEGTRQQRQLQLIILQPQTTVPQTSTDKQTTMMTSSYEWRTNSPLEPSTLSTVFDSSIGDNPGIPVTAPPLKKRVVYTVALPGMLAVILIIVVIFVARYQWRKKNVDTPVQSFELEA